LGIPPNDRLIITRNFSIVNKFYHKSSRFIPFFLFFNQIIAKFTF